MVGFGGYAEVGSGERRMTDDAEVTEFEKDCFHESSHAVVAVLCGLDFPEAHVSSSSTQTPSLESVSPPVDCSSVLTRLNNQLAVSKIESAYRVLRDYLPSLAPIAVEELQLLTR